MPTLLRFDLSSRADASFSRRLGDRIEAAWRAEHPNGVVHRHDLSVNPPAHLTADTIAGFFTPSDQMDDKLRSATNQSDQLIETLKNADDILFTIPLYNFGIPAALKTWIDQIVRINQTFSYDGSQFEGLVRAKTAHVVCTYGAPGYLDGGNMSQADFAKPYMDFILKFIGIDDVRHYGVEGTSVDPQAAEAQLNNIDIALTAKEAA